jgi:hypothetical protein
MDISFGPLPAAAVIRNTCKRKTQHKVYIDNSERLGQRGVVQHTLGWKLSFWSISFGFTCYVVALRLCRIYALIHSINT